MSQNIYYLLKNYAFYRKPYIPFYLSSKFILYSKLTLYITTEFLSYKNNRIVVVMYGY